ncbi:GNAT family N-acetyltransferase [Luteococcus sp. Sow4_B9]|uniref:GNAT family N-acetyltransferase n=1 Tax=Luteococcus sp. Sow4_B9 TaxID=3438792 RepID=UPI003F991414
MDPFVEGTLEWTALVADDLEELAELRTAVEYFDDPVTRMGLDELWECYEDPDGDPQADAVVGRDRGGTIVAYGWNLPRGVRGDHAQLWLDGAIHPAWRHQGLGHRLLEWQVARAREWLLDLRTRRPEVHRVHLVRYVQEKAVAQAKTIQDVGFVAQRWYYDMHLGFETADGSPWVLPTMPDTGEVQLQPYHPELSEQVRQAHNEAFAQSPGVHKVSRQAWEHQMRRRAARPEWSWVATHQGKVVGYAMNCANVQDWEAMGWREGWTDRLGVRPDWRGHRLGHALLIASMKSFQDAGLQGAGLGVDTDDPDGALELFTSIGYESEETVVLYGRELRVDDDSE